MKRTRTVFSGGYLFSVIMGGVSAVLFLGLLFLAAVLGERRSEIMSAPSVAAGVCLFVSALLCGLCAGGRAGERKLLHALAAEGTLLALVLLFALGCGNTPRPGTLLLDLALLLFGAFAGTLRRGKGRVKRRGKR